MASARAEQNERKLGDFSNWLQRVRETGEFSDVVVEVEGKEFHLHMLPLLNASLFFRNLPSVTHVAGGDANVGRNVPSRRRLILHDGLVGGANAFSIAADFCYLIKPNFTVQNVARILSAAKYLGMVDLVGITKQFLYTNVFNDWRACIAFLMQYKKVAFPSVEEYMKSRCMRTIITACAKACLDTKNLSVPISSGSALNTSWQSSVSHTLSDILVRTCSLQDDYVAHIIQELVTAEVNLNLKCRQGRNAKAWLDSTLGIECRSVRVRCWIVICLARMLEKSVTADRPWLELSSQYWCSLLHHVGCCKEQAARELAAALSGGTDKENIATKWVQMSERLKSVNCFLERRIGGSLHELDDHLLSYNIQSHVLLSLVAHFREGVQCCSLVNRKINQTDLLEIHQISDANNPDDGQAAFGAITASQPLISWSAVKEVTMEVDACLWSLVRDETCLLSPQDFIYLVESFPPPSRESHDSLYAAIEKLLERHMDANGGIIIGNKQIRKLWSLVDVSKLSSQFRDKAYSNTLLLHQPVVMKHALHQHGQDLEILESEKGNLKGVIGNGQNLSCIMQKVVNASVKLLEENSRQSMEIMELKKQYTELLQQCSSHSMGGDDTASAASIISSSCLKSSSSSSQMSQHHSEPPTVSKSIRATLRNLHRRDDFYPRRHCQYRHQIGGHQ